MQFMETRSQQIDFDSYIQRLVRIGTSELSAGFLPAEVAKRMLEPLDLLAIKPDVILDASHFSGHTLPQLRQYYPNARCVHLSPSELLAATDAVIGSAEQIELPSSSIDLIVSHLSFDWQLDLMACFKQFLRILKPGGAVLFSMYGPDTLQELRYAFSQVDSQQHVHAFFDMHDIGDWLTQASFIDPVMTKEMITLRYRHLTGLFNDLRSTGSSNVLSDRMRGLMGRRRWQAMINAYEVFRQEGKLTASFEIINGHAWKPSHTQEVVDGEVRVSVDSIQRKA